MANNFCEPFMVVLSFQKDQDIERRALESELFATCDRRLRRSGDW